MLIFSDWIIKTDGDLIARQYDNLTRELLVMGTLPEGWAWELLVQAGGSVNVIALSPRKGGVGVTLTAEMLTKAGLYALQLRGGRGEEVRHTNVIQVVVPTSLVGDATWPELPSEFSQAEANIRALNAHPPYAGPNGYWMIWDLETGDYVESQLSLPEVSVGPQGPEGKAASIRVGSVLTGEPGSQAAVSNSGTENNAILDFVLPRGQIGPTGPSGADGRDGKDGVPGAAATIQVGAVTTGEPGTQAQVVNVGTENAAMLQFTIPRGQPGADGRDGKNGQDGAPGPAGVGVPEISDGDEGKVMTARSGQAVWETPQGGDIPQIGTADDGKMLTARNGNWTAEEPPCGFLGDQILFDKTVQTEENPFGKNVYTEPTDKYLESNVLYTVVFDGETYESYPTPYQGAYTLGNISIAFPEGADTGENFVVATSSEQGFFLLYTRESGIYTLKISGKKVKKLDSSFLERPIIPGTGELSEIHNDPGNTADGAYSHAEGLNTAALGYGSHAEGSGTTASEKGSHAEGSGTTASGIYSHAEGKECISYGDCSHAEGVGTVTFVSGAHVQGKYNSDESNFNYAHIVGCGESDTMRANAHTISWAGDGWFRGKLYLGGDRQDDPDAWSAGLPKYTESDEGKILKIVDGVPTWVTP